ncbi:hypothetical protein [Paenibacillus sp. R14(2021)]|uniref:hypothetical protein n=1 Tax=Paenibacillus sp. R14(2021) TaxID=2859228 RepID=UPI001C613E3B|nr:hypothetical protein [Paenibacillus sp. R14(2021)]
MKPVYARPAAYAAAAALLAVSITGCQFESAAPLGNASDSNTAVNGKPAGVSRATGSPQQTFDDTKGGNIGPSAADATPDDGNDAAAASTSGKTGEKPASTSAKPGQEWDSRAPKLHGIALGDAKSALDSKFGKPTDTYVLDDDKEKLAVSEYRAFSIGYSADKKAKFIEVFDKSAASGLNGLRVGDEEGTAVKVLGKPHTHTSSVLVYEASGALLKLDLDPANHQILSIKLFSSK